MRKLILCAAAAIVALASCTKTQVINTEEPKEIGFKAIVGAITKADDTPAAPASNLPSDMGVIAYVKVDSNYEDYFGNTKFSGSGATAWISNPIQYWPVAHNLDFIVYAPFTNTTPSVTTTSSSTSTTTDNSGNTTTTTSATLEVSDIDISGDDQIDYLYGACYYSNKTYSNGDVPVILNHALAKVTVNFTGSNVTIDDLVLDQAVQEGSYIVTYAKETADDYPGTIDWTPDATNKRDREITGGESFYVIPETYSTISFTYKMDNSSIALPYTIDFTEIQGNEQFKWEAGKHYIINVNISNNAITFAPTVTTWDDVNSEDNPNSNFDVEL